MNHHEGTNELKQRYTARIKEAIRQAELEKLRREAMERYEETEMQEQAEYCYYVLICLVSIFLWVVAVSVIG